MCPVFKIVRPFRTFVQFQENLTVKENKINTTQSAEELQSSFTPGNEFGFNATIELEKAEMEKPSDE